MDLWTLGAGTNAAPRVGNMHCRLRVFGLALAIAAFFAGPVVAEPIPSVGILLTAGAGGAIVSSIDDTGRVSWSRGPARLDYAVFAYEILAYVAKEVLPDSPEEYFESPIGSRLSRDMPERRSEFGSHCLMVIADFRSSLSPGGVSSLGTRPGALDYAVEAATAALALRQIWSAFRNDLTRERSGFALDPKVGARKIGLHLTFRW